MHFSTLALVLPLALSASAGPLNRRQSSGGSSKSSSEGASSKSASGGGSSKSASGGGQVVGETTTDAFPPASPTNTDGSLFPAESIVGFPGPTPTGAEPALIATASSQPMLQGYFPLVNPPTKDGASNGSIYSWGNLSPMRSLPVGTFGLDSSPEVPDQCTLEQVHLVHRHGARYSTSTGPIASFAGRLHNATLNSTVKATGSLSFLNTWKYKLGAEILSPFGREQLFVMGVAFRQRYGFLLDKFTAANALPVFQTTSEDRMYKSAINFAAGFFGLPYENQYHQSIIIEQTGFNNSLSGYTTCNNSNAVVGNLGAAIQANFSAIYLQPALQRLKPLLSGYNLTVTDVAAMQQLCSYETVSLGYSAFCDLFTEEEFQDYSYYFALGFWYSNSFGNPTSAALGLGWAQTLLSRLTHEHIPTYNSSVNSTLANSDVTNPLNQTIYVDATHDTIVSSIVVALNLTSLAADGPLPTTQRPSKRSFFVEQIAPFGTQLTAQVMSCSNSSSAPGDQIRFILNDAVIPATGMKGCPKNKDGLCPTSTFIRGLRQRNQEIDWNYACNGNYTYSVPKGGGGITNGLPPKKSSNSTS